MAEHVAAAERVNMLLSFGPAVTLPSTSPLQKRENMVLVLAVFVSHDYFTVDKVLACLSLVSELTVKHHELNSYAVWLGEQFFVVLQFCMAKLLNSKYLICWC